MEIADVLQVLQVLLGAALVLWAGLVVYFRVLRKRTAKARSLLVVLGSGGHTMEMMRLLSGLEISKYSPRTYVLAQTDKISESKLAAFEQKSTGAEPTPNVAILRIPRSREVKQSWITTLFTAAWSLLYCLPIPWRSLPDVLLCNGPGTCIPLCVAAYALRLLGLKKIEIIYVESICRVTSLSLSAKLLYYFADHILVQWPELQAKYPRTEYIGRLV